MCLLDQRHRLKGVIDDQTRPRASDAVADAPFKALPEVPQGPQVQEEGNSGPCQ